MIEQHTRRGEVVLLDDTDSDLFEYKWSVSNGSAGRSLLDPQTKKSFTVQLARVVAERINGGPLEPTQEAMHKNRNPLDNRRENISIASRRCISRHKGKCKKPTTSKYRGVCWFKNTNRWVARIGINGKNLHLGYFTSEAVAAEAYDRAAIKLFGKCAYQNFPDKEASL